MISKVYILLLPESVKFGILTEGMDKSFWLYPQRIARLVGETDSKTINEQNWYFTQVRSCILHQAEFYHTICAPEVCFFVQLFRFAHLFIVVKFNVFQFSRNSHLLRNESQSGGKVGGENVDKLFCCPFCGQPLHRMVATHFVAIFISTGQLKFSTTEEPFQGVCSQITSNIIRRFPSIIRRNN